MKKLCYKIILIPYLLLILIFTSCNTTEPIPDDPITADKKEGIYALRQTSPDLWGELCYSDYDSINFKKIDGCDYLKDVLIDLNNNLLIGVSDEKLFFVELLTNKKIKEINIPQIENPEPYFSRTIIALFPCKWNPDIAFLCNWSVYQINLKSLSIEKVVWDATKSDKIIYTHDAKLNEDGKILYLKITLLGYWIENQITRYESRQRLVKLNLTSNKLDTIFNFPREDDGGGAIRLFYINKYLFSYNLKYNILLQFLTTTDALIDSFSVSKSYYFFSSFSFGDSIIIQEANTGSFFIMHPDPVYFEEYIPLFYNFGDIQATTYQTLKGGDAYACFKVNSLNKFFIIDLMTKKVVRQFQNDSIYKIYLFQKGD